ncbi:hypothetical protein WN48_07294 [Eufriesea mexicana]|uniref:Uncharacterized protein n=1 Tax=Eufriesea mexicana TaxID=516756 RepID=A0A310SVI3_9HYME|nr:hypothetical protein WN48_07294 [Eufriesea mexicana]
MIHGAIRLRGIGDGGSAKRARPPIMAVANPSRVMTGAEANLMRSGKGFDRRESGLPPLWQFSVSCRIPTHWKLRNTEEAQKGYGFEIKRTSDGDADTGDYSVASPPPRENKPFFPLGGGGGARATTKVSPPSPRHSLFLACRSSACQAIVHRLRFFREFFAGLRFVLAREERGPRPPTGVSARGGGLPASLERAGSGQEYRSRARREGRVVWEKGVKILGKSSESRVTGFGAVDRRQKRRRRTLASAAGGRSPLEADTWASISPRSDVPETVKEGTEGTETPAGTTGLGDQEAHAARGGVEGNGGFLRASQSDYRVPQPPGHHDAESICNKQRRFRWGGGRGGGGVSNKEEHRST